MARLPVPTGPPALRALRRLVAPRPRSAAPTHARVSALAAPRSAAIGGTLAAATAVVAIAGLAAGAAGRGQVPRADQRAVAGGQPMVRTAGDLGDAYAAGVVGGSGLPGSPGAALIGFGGGAEGGTAGGGVENARAPIADMTPPSALAAGGIPLTALTAYKNAAAAEAAANPKCRLPWPLLAGIGRVESNHGRFAGAVLHASGVSTPRIIGIPLNGNGTALIRDTDGGRVDGDTVYDRAVGPMQFIPSTWQTWGRDGNKDGVKDPFNVFDAAAAAADYLCAAGRDLGTYSGQVAAVLSYNHSDAYVSEVLGLEKIYASGAVGVTIPVIPASPDPKPGRHAGQPKLPPVDPGPPRALIPPTKPARCGTKVSKPCSGTSGNGGHGSTTSSSVPDPVTSTSDPGSEPPSTETTTSEPPVTDPTSTEPDPPTDTTSGSSSSADVPNGNPNDTPTVDPGGVTP